MNKEYQAIIFPKVGHSFSRYRSHYKPAAYGHGGISIQELLIPMVGLQVEGTEEELLTLQPIDGPKKVIGRRDRVPHAPVPSSREEA